MRSTAKTEKNEASSLNAPASLRALARAEQECRRCPLYRNATQAVPGEGPRRARLLLIGEQPGNDEDLAGKPFVGPAGRILDRALHDAGITRRDAFVTNAVKHFKFSRRGKRRLHERPNAEEIRICHAWLEIERKLVKPVLSVAMGATAARSVLGRTVAISKNRGTVMTDEEGHPVLVTVHPSFMLRIPDETARHAEHTRFVEDLRVARDFLSSEK